MLALKDCNPLTCQGETHQEARNETTTPYLSETIGVQPANATHRDGHDDDRHCDLRERDKCVVRVVLPRAVTTKRLQLRVSHRVNHEGESRHEQEPESSPCCTIQFKGRHACIL